MAAAKSGWKWGKPIEEREVQAVVGSRLRFFHAGYGHVLCANRIVAIFPVGSGPTRRMMTFAKRTETYVDITRGRETKSYILMQDGVLYGCAFNPLTVMGRINGDTPAKEAVDAKGVDAEEEYDDTDIGGDAGEDDGNEDE